MLEIPEQKCMMNQLANWLEFYAPRITKTIISIPFTQFTFELLTQKL